MAIEFFEILGEVRREKASAASLSAEDALSMLVRELGMQRHLERHEVEEAVRRLELDSAELAALARNANGKGRHVLASNAVVECGLRAWPARADIFGLVPARGFEVVRVLRGKMTVTEHAVVRGRMDPYCIAELSEGAVVGMPAGVVYRMENRKRENALTLHFTCPPARLMPASEGIRRLYARGLAQV